MNILLITACSITIELENYKPYKCDMYDIYLNDTLYKSTDLNVFSIYDLTPNSSYKLRINDEEIIFKTLDKKLIYYKHQSDDNLGIQEALDKLSSNEVLVLTDEYYVTNLFLNDNNSIYLKKGSKILGNINRTDYKILYKDEYLNNLPLGTWEGRGGDTFASIINVLGKKNVLIFGEGVVDVRADKADWWENHRVQRIAWRPKGIFIHTSSNIILEGITVKNTPSWNQHPFYSSNLKYLNLNLENPSNSPTTDGCDPEACDNVLICGCRISVGDDCIAIKSSKIELASIYHRASSNIVIRNNYMNMGHAGVTLGSENSGGINNVIVTKCLFNETDRGLRIKSQRGRGKDAIISNIVFNNIIMEGVKSPFVINAFYKAGNDVVDYRFDYSYRKPDDTTPSLGEFLFENIKCNNVCYGVGFFQGLPESKIKKVTLKNVSVSFNKDSKAGEMAMCVVNEKYYNVGFVLNNICEFHYDVIFINNPSELFIDKSCDKIINLNKK